MIPDKESILAHRNWAVIKRFQKEYPSKSKQAEQIFEDLMLFFWASKVHEKEKREFAPGNVLPRELDFAFIMDEEMKDIDLMWHVYLLYTQDYSEFCDKNFGEFLHHLPDLVPDGRIETKEYSSQIEKFLVYCEKKLGEEVLKRWFPLSIEFEVTHG